VTEETRARVLAAMQALGYEPNASARRLRRQHNNVLGMALAGLSGRPGISDLYFLDLTRGVSIAVDQAGYDLMVFGNHQALQTESFYQSLKGKQMIDGLIASGSAINPRGLERLTGALPIVLIGRYLHQVDVCRVSFSYKQDAYLATQFLIGRGHRRIGLLLNLFEYDSEPLRLEGYRTALEEAGLPFDPALVRNPLEREIYPDEHEVRSLIIDQRITALVTAPYIEICTYLMQAGEPYNRVEVVTVDFERIVPRTPNLVAGLSLAKYEAGLQAVNLLLRLIKGDPDVPRQSILSSNFESFFTPSVAESLP
jgi:DNA-binding LacI/PurR family transcriptional regulator